MKKIALSVLLVLAEGFLIAQGRFDLLVREDFFAGLAGDLPRLERAIRKCDEALAANPENAPALVWHGGGLFAQSGLAFRRGDNDTAMQLQQRGLKEMADAVAIEPDSLQTRIPRGAMLIGSARFMDDQYARPLLEIGVSDYEKSLDLEKAIYPNLSVHAKGELLGGLADGYRRLGNTAKARENLERIVRELPGSPYEKQANRR